MIFCRIYRLRYKEVERGSNIIFPTIIGQLTRSIKRACTRYKYIFDISRFNSARRNFNMFSSVITHPSNFARLTRIITSVLKPPTPNPSALSNFPPCRTQPSSPVLAPFQRLSIRHCVCFFLSLAQVVKHLVSLWIVYQTLKRNNFWCGYRIKCFVWVIK